jgi:hypothetical protein
MPTSHSFTSAGAPLSSTAPAEGNKSYKNLLVSWSIVCIYSMRKANKTARVSVGSSRESAVGDCNLISTQMTAEQLSETTGGSSQA